MPGIHFDYSVNDSPFYESADRIVRRISDMSKVIDNVGKNVSFAPLLSNLDKLMKDMSLSGEVVDGIKEKLTSSINAIASSTDSAEKKQLKFRDAIVEAFQTIASSVDSELEASKTVLNNFYAELDSVMEGIKKQSADIIDIDAIKDKITEATNTFATMANPEQQSVAATDPDTGETYDKMVDVDEAIRALREKAVEDVRAINDELQALVSNIGDGTADQVQATLDGLAPLEAQLNVMLNKATDQKLNAKYDSDEWNEAVQQLYVYQKALDEVKAIKDAINNEIPNAAEAEALKQQAAELEDLIAMEETAVEKLEASKAAIEETINATQDVGSSSPSTGSVASNTPQVYLTQEDYENVKQMREEIENLQNQISQFDGSEQDLTALKEQLSDMNDQLREAEMTAVETAAAYGDKLGTKASAVSEHLYEMNAAVDEQKEKVDKLSEEYDKAVEAVNALDKSTDTDARQKAINEYEEIAQKLHEAKAELANLEVEQHEANNAWIETTAEMQRHDSVLVKLLGGEEKFKEITSQLPGPLSEAINGLTGMTGAAKAFIATPLGAVLAALILAWQALNTWFERSEEGQKALAEITGYLSGVMETLKDVVASVGEALYKAFTNPQKAGQAFLNFLKDQIVNRLKAVGQIGSNVGSILYNAFTFNWDGVKQGVKDLANSVAQFGTGIEKPITKAKNAIVELNNKAKESAKIAVEEKELQREEAKTKKLVAEYDNRAKQLEAKGKRRTAEETKELKSLQKKMSDAEMAIVDKKIELQERAMANGKYDTIEDQNKLDELYAEREKLLGKEAAKQERLRSQELAAGKKAAKERADQQAKSIQQQLKYNDELQKLQDEAAEARSKAEIAAIRNDAERERKEREYQHKQTIKNIEKQNEDIAKTIYEEQKKAYETANKGKHFELSDKGYGGDWRKLIATSDDEAKKLYGEDSKYYLLWKTTQEKMAAERKSLDTDFYRDNEKRIKSEEKSNREAINSYLKQYGDYAKKKHAIYDDANNEICELEEQLAVTTDETAREAIEARVNTVKEGTKRQIEDLDVQYGKIKAVMIDLFEEAGKKSVNEIDRIIKKYEVLIDFLKVGGTGSRDILIAQGFSDSEIDRILREFGEKSIESIDRVRERIKTLKGELGNRSPWLQFKNNLEEAFKNLRKKDADNPEGGQVGLGLEKIGSSIQQITPELDNLTDGLGKCFNIDTSDLQKANKMLSEFGGLVNGIGQIAQKNYIGGAISIIGSLGSIIDDLSGKKTDILESINNNIDVANDRISRLSDVLEKGYGITAQEVAQREREAIARKQGLLYQGLNNSDITNPFVFGSSVFKSVARMLGLNVEFDESPTQWGKNFIESFNGEQLAKIFYDLRESGSEAWERIANDTNNWGTYVQQLAESFDELKNVDISEKIQITGTSFESVVDGMTDSIYNLADSSEEVTDEIGEDFDKMMNRMVINNVLRNQLEKDLREWYNAWYDAWDEDKDISNDERERLRTRYQTIYDDYAKQVQQLKDDGILNPLPDEKEAENRLSSIREAWVSTIMDMKGDTESLGKDIARIMFESLVNSNIFNDEFDTWLEGWLKKYNEAMDVLAPGEREARLNQLYKERDDKVKELTEDTKKYAEATGYSAEAAEDLSDALDNLGDTLLDTLLDTEKDAEQMGAEIGRTLVREMMNEILASEKYAKPMENIRKVWQNVLKSGNGSWTDTEGLYGEKGLSYTLDTVLEKIAALNYEIASDKDIQKATQAWKDFDKALQDTSSSFGNIKDMFMSAILDIEDGADDFSRKINETLVKDIIDKKVFDGFDVFQKDWTSRYLKALEAGDEELLKTLLQELEAREKAMAESAESYARQLKELSPDTTFTGMESNFVSALMDMEGDVDDFANDIKKTIVQRLVESFMVSEKIKPLLEDLQETFDKVSGMDGTVAAKAALLATGFTDEEGRHFRGIDSIKQPLEDMGETVSAALTAIGYQIKETSPFENLAESITDSLSSADGSVDTFMKSIRQTVVDNLVASTVASEDFTKRIEDAQNELTAAVIDGDEERIASAENALRTLYGSIEETTRKYNDSLKEADKEFVNLTDSFLSSLFDTNKTAEDWAQDIGRTMAQRIIREMMSVSMIQPLLDNLQTVFDSAVGNAKDAEGNVDWTKIANDASIRQAIEQIKTAYPGLQETVENIYTSLGVSLEEAKEGFSDLQGSFVSALTSMENDAETFGKSIGQTMYQQMLDVYVSKKFEKDIEELNERWAEALESGKPEKIEAIRQSVEALYTQIGNDTEVQSLIDKIREIDEATPFDNLRSSFLSYIMDMKGDVNDFAKSINEMLTEAFVDEFVLGKAFDEQLELWKKEYLRIKSGDMSAEERATEMRKLQNTIVAARDEYAKGAREIQDLMAYGEYQDQDATVNMADNATYDQFETYLGIAVSQQITSERQLNIQQQILYTLQAMTGITTPDSEVFNEIRGQMVMANAHLLDIRKSNRDMLEVVGGRLQSIDNKLSKL